MVPGLMGWCECWVGCAVDEPLGDGESEVRLCSGVFVCVELCAHEWKEE